MKGVSLIICCYNSASRLPETLRHLERQVVKPNVAWELIIVNNNSTDQTKDLALSFKANHPHLSVIVLDETTPGLSFARKKGFEHAAYEYLLMCDDDNWLNENYLQTVYDIFEDKAEIGIVGGIGEAVSDVPFPEWFDKYKQQYAVGHSGKTGIVTSVYGAGMGLRKSVYFEALKNGFLSLLSDRKGKELSSGGDIEICFIFRLLGYKVYQCDKLFFKHFIDGSKLTDNYLKRLNIGFAKTLVVLRPYTLVLEQRKEGAGMLWFKEYCHLVKSALLNIYNKKENLDYLKASLQLMVIRQAEFCNNIRLIRSLSHKIFK